MDFNTVLDNLVFLLKPSDPYKIILFGSRVTGKSNEDNDIVFSLPVSN
jgi:predicted nucleotidyltransferase